MASRRVPPDGTSQTLLHPAAHRFVPLGQSMQRRAQDLLRTQKSQTLGSVYGSVQVLETGGFATPAGRLSPALFSHSWQKR